MTEKRADYRKNQRRKKLSQLWSRQQTKSEDKDTEYNTVDVNPEFRRNDEKVDISSEGNTTEEKVSRLKRRLNWAILIVIILIIIVLLALFKL